MRPSIFRPPEQPISRGSTSTCCRELARLIEPRVVSPQRRMEIIRRAKNEGLETGIIIAPVFPPVRIRPDVEGDIETIFRELSEVRPDHIYGECIHVRGVNMQYVERALGERIELEGFDRKAGRIFYNMLKKYNLNGEWWYENRPYGRNGLY